MFLICKSFLKSDGITLLLLEKGAPNMIYRFKQKMLFDPNPFSSAIKLKHIEDCCIASNTMHSFLEAPALMNKYNLNRNYPNTNRPQNNSCTQLRLTLGTNNLDEQDYCKVITLIIDNDTF